MRSLTLPPEPPMLWRGACILIVVASEMRAGRPEEARRLTLEGQQLCETLQMPGYSMHGSLGERSVTGELLRLLGEGPVSDYVRWSIALVLKKLISDMVDIQQLAHLLASSDIADTVYTLLWKVSRQAAVSIFPVGDPIHENVEVVSWEDGDGLR